ncbi:MAG: hypothetical protein M3680_11475 [Myxococcota bacterium]|nr:hypothetical protein [Myxococcota bacterium]
MLSVVFILAMGACGNFGSCGACGATTPLPADTSATLRGLPKDQTVEGGAQIRVTPQGFAKLTSILPTVLNQQLSAGFCVPRGEVGNCAGGLGTGACYCTANNGGGCNPGCKVNVGLNPNGLQLSVTSSQRLNLRLSTNISTTVRIQGQVVGVDFTCNLGVSSNNLNGDLDILLGTRPSDGELTLRLERINNFNLGLDFSGCGPLSSIGNFVSTVLDSFIGEFIVDLLTPTINNLIQSFLPNPLGMAGMVNLASLLEGISPGTDGTLEARIVPGGYADLINNGMSLGVITGINADEDLSTRTAGLTSEPHLCVPPLAAPNFGAPPANLPLSARSTFKLDRAGAFTGGTGNEPPADLAMGLSETMLDQLGHHLVTSGGMCLGIGTSYINQLNVSTVGLLVPSLADLGSDDGNDPLLLVTRPQRALDFTIGNNTATSPALSIGISNLEVDFYAFLYERYVRAFTMDLSMNVGINLEFEQLPGQPARIKPTLVGISSSEVQIKVINSQFVSESAARLESVLPSVFDLVTPLLGNLPAIDVPSFAGFSLSNLSIQKVTTSQDDFLALYASLGAGAMLKNLAHTDHLAAAVVKDLDSQIAVQQPQSQGRIKLLRVATPDVAQVRSALAQEPAGVMPEVVFEVDRFDARGRELEWSYNLNGGMWRAYQSGTGPLVIRDRAFAWQGRYTIGLQSRVKGDYTTTSAVTETPVVIDSVGPRIVTAKAAWNGDRYEVPLFDIVSDKAVQYAFARPRDADPILRWTAGGTASIDRMAIASYLQEDELAVYARDELGNVSIALLAPFHGQPGEAGCACDTGGGPSGGGIVLVLIVGGVLVGGRRRRGHLAGRLRRVVRGLRTFARTRAGRTVTTLAAWVVISTAVSLAPGCSCGNASEKSCETVADCGPDFCPEGEIPFCIDNTCVCSDDIPIGRVGPYSDVAVAADGTIWVSGYAQTYGDLVVTRAIPGRIPDESWEWVDGVPDGPVVVDGGKYRNGVAEKGEDVGMYTSIAVAKDGSPMVTYFDRDTASLKFARKNGDVWEKHTIEAGSGTLTEFSGELLGMYTSLTLRTDDGRPGVAYLAHVADATGTRAEVRFAASQVPFPTSAGDWMTWVVDSAPLPPEDPASPDVYPLPGGLGLFVDVARMPDQAPVVVYYDRTRGELRMSKFNTATGQFAAAVVLDGTGDNDAGWSPSVAVGADGVVHVAYVAATGDDLRYITTAPNARSEIVDDGYRVVGVTVDNLPKPEFHFVGEDAGLVLANNGQTPMISYQDGTTQELLLTDKKSDGTWNRISVAGAVEPWPGAYGFFASSAVSGTEIVMSTWVINQTLGENWVEVFKRPTALQ